MSAYPQNQRASVQPAAAAKPSWQQQQSRVSAPPAAYQPPSWQQPAPVAHQQVPTTHAPQNALRSQDSFDDFDDDSWDDDDDSSTTTETPGVSHCESSDVMISTCIRFITCKNYFFHENL